MKPIQDETSSIGVKLPRIQAEKARLRLLKAGILLKAKKIIRDGDFVIFPVSDTSIVSNILEDLEYKLEYHVFPEEIIERFPKTESKSVLFNIVYLPLLSLLSMIRLE